MNKFAASIFVAALPVVQCGLRDELSYPGLREYDSHNQWVYRGNTGGMCTYKIKYGKKGVEENQNGFIVYHCGRYDQHKIHLSALSIEKVAKNWEAGSDTAENMDIASPSDRIEEIYFVAGGNSMRASQTVEGMILPPILQSARHSPRSFENVKKTMFVVVDLPGYGKKAPHTLQQSLSARPSEFQVQTGYGIVVSKEQVDRSWFHQEGSFVLLTKQGILEIQGFGRFPIDPEIQYKVVNCNRVDDIMRKSGRVALLVKHADSAAIDAEWFRKVKKNDKQLTLLSKKGISQFQLLGYKLHTDSDYEVTKQKNNQHLDFATMTIRRTFPENIDSWFETKSAWNRKTKVILSQTGIEEFNKRLDDHGKNVPPPMAGAQIKLTSDRQYEIPDQVIWKADNSEADSKRQKIKSVANVVKYLKDSKSANKLLLFLQPLTAEDHRKQANGGKASLQESLEYNKSILTTVTKMVESHNGRQHPREGSSNEVKHFNFYGFSMGCANVLQVAADHDFINKTRRIALYAPFKSTFRVAKELLKVPESIGRAFLGKTWGWDNQAQLTKIQEKNDDIELVIMASVWDRMIDFKNSQEMIEAVPHSIQKVKYHKRHEKISKTASLDEWISSTGMPSEAFEKTDKIKTFSEPGQFEGSRYRVTKVEKGPQVTVQFLSGDEHTDYHTFDACHDTENKVEFLHRELIPALFGTFDETPGEDIRSQIKVSVDENTETDYQTYEIQDVQKPGQKITTRFSKMYAFCHRPEFKGASKFVPKKFEWDRSPQRRAKVFHRWLKEANVSFQDLKNHVAIPRGQETHKKVKKQIKRSTNGSRSYGILEEKSVFSNPL